MTAAARPALAALATLTVLRLALAAALPLSPDEAYYWVWSRALAAGYLDHPPMVALLIRAGTALAGESEFGVRLAAPLAAGAGSLLLASAGEDLAPGRHAGLIAAALLNASLLFGAGAVLMTPDTPLLLFWTATLAALARGLRSDDGRWWLAAGLAAGLALASKLTALLLLGAVGLWLLALPETRRMLATPWPWLGLGIATLVFAPTLAWNAAHGWAGFVKQGGRVTAWQPARAGQFLGELLAGQIGLATPLVFLLCAAGTVAALRRARTDAAAALLAASVAVPGLVFLAHALGDRVQGNWPAGLYPGAALAAAAFAGPAWRRWWRPAVLLGLAITATVYVQALAAPLPLPAALDPSLLRLAGWRGFATAVAAERQRAGAGYVAAENYALAAMLAWTLPAGVAVVGLEPRWALFALPDAAPLLREGPGLLVRSAHRAAGDSTPIATLERRRGASVAETYRLFRLPPGADLAPAVLLPRRGTR